MKHLLIYLVAALIISGCQSPAPPKPSTPPSVVQKHPVPVPRPPTDSGGGQIDTPPVGCDNYKTQVNQAKQAKNLDKLADLLATLKRQSDCSADYLDEVKRNMSEMAAAKATSLVQRGQLKEAEKWLNYKYVPVNLWSTQAVRGEIAAKRKRWNEAAVFYNQALDLIADKNATRQKPSETEIKRVYQLAAETQLLAGNPSMRNDGQPSGIMREDLGIEIKARPIPVQFVFGKTILTEKGQDSAKQLVRYLSRKTPNQITLIGHTDHVGSDPLNCDLSKGRASAVKNYLVAAGIRANIMTLGKGEREPLELYDPTMYTQEEIDQINRRVEFAVDSDVSSTNACL
jgi:outer membrane protein OmpA-like peptidoglycan-associated protein